MQREPRPEKYEVRTPLGIRTIPEKYETWTPLGRVMIAAVCVLLFVAFMGLARQATPEKSEPEPDICEGLTRLQCMEARDLERRRMEHVEALQDADMMP